MVTYAVKWDKKILVTEQNRNSLVWYKFIQEELSEIDAIKQKYWYIIYSKYSQTDQANMTARASEIAIESKGRDYTVDEISDIEYARVMILWIREKRLECQTIIDNL